MNDLEQEIDETQRKLKSLYAKKRWEKTTEEERKEELAKVRKARKK